MLVFTLKLNEIFDAQWFHVELFFTEIMLTENIFTDIYIKTLNDVFCYYIAKIHYCFLISPKVMPI